MHVAHLLLLLVSIIFNRFYAYHSKPHMSFITNSPVAALSADSIDTALVESLITERIECRKHRNFQRADEIKHQLESAPFHLEIIDHSYKVGGGSTFKYRNVDVTHRDILNKLKIAGASDTPFMTREEEISFLAELMTLLSEDERKDIDHREMQGRKFIDAAFELALLGIHDKHIFDKLIENQIKELQRWGPRVSVRAIDIVKMMEKAACAGIPAGHELYRLGATLLRDKPDADGDTAAQLLSFPGNFSLSSARPKMFLWKHLAKQTKAGRQNAPQTSSPLVQESLRFADPTLPLIIDLGCGLGVSLLGLAAGGRLSDGEESLQPLNYLGLEMNVQSIRYANGIARRWGVEDRVQFLLGDCLAGMQRVEREYLGPVELIMLHFPSPFRLTPDQACTDDDASHATRAAGNDADILSEDELPDLMGTLDLGHDEDLAGNTQLPNKSEFMLCSPLAQKIEHVLAIGGALYMQSNVEDVALWMRRLVEANTGLEAPREVSKAHLDRLGVGQQDQWASISPNEALSERQKRYFAYGGQMRAAGEGWLKQSPMHPCSHTETEILCNIEEKPVHRIIFKKKCTMLC